MPTASVARAGNPWQAVRGFETLRSRECSASASDGIGLEPAEDGESFVPHGAVDHLLITCRHCIARPVLPITGPVERPSRAQWLIIWLTVIPALMFWITALAPSEANERIAGGLVVVGGLLFWQFGKRG